MLCFSSCVFKTRLWKTQSALIGQFTHAWPSTPNNNRSDVLNQFLPAKQATRHKLRKCVTLWHSVMSQSDRIKGNTSGEAFQEECFLWERGASVCVDIELFSSEDLLHAWEHAKQKKLQKIIIILLKKNNILLFVSSCNHIVETFLVYWNTQFSGYYAIKKQLQSQTPLRMFSRNEKIQLNVTVTV